jgi:valyl-tRNA synthetase
MGRQLRGEYKIPPNKKVPFQLRIKFNSTWQSDPPTENELEVLKALLNASDLKLTDLPPPPIAERNYPVPGRLVDLGDDPWLYTDFMGWISMIAIDLIDPAVERDRLTKELAKVEKDLEQTRRKLGDANMLAKAPPAKIEEWRLLEISLVEKEKSLRESLKKLEG